jgi:hypothetical protein
MDKNLLDNKIEEANQKLGQMRQRMLETEKALDKTRADVAFQSGKLQQLGELREELFSEKKTAPPKGAK